MKMLTTLVFGAIGVAGMAGGRLAPDVIGAPEQPPRCLLTQGSDPRGGPYPIPRGKEARREAAKTPQVPSAALRSAADIPLPGRPVRFDYQSQDPGSGRLYISHMNDAHVVVFDIRTRQVVGRISGTPGVTGVWVVPELKKLYASVTGRRYVAVIDTDSLTVRATPGPIGFPDGIAYAPEAKRVFVSDESGGGELVIDGVTDRVVARISIGGEQETPSTTPGRGVSWWRFRRSIRSLPSIHGQQRSSGGMPLRARIIHMGCTSTLPIVCCSSPARGTRRWR